MLNNRCVECVDVSALWGLVLVPIHSWELDIIDAAPLAVVDNNNSQISFKISRGPPALSCGDGVKDCFLSIEPPLDLALLADVTVGLLLLPSVFFVTTTDALTSFIPNWVSNSVADAHWQ
jgi:hypothetical protein